MIIPAYALRVSSRQNRSRVDLQPVAVDDNVAVLLNMWSLFLYLCVFCFHAFNEIRFLFHAYTSICLSNCMKFRA